MLFCFQPLIASKDVYLLKVCYFLLLEKAPKSQNISNFMKEKEEEVYTN